MQILVVAKEIPEIQCISSQCFDFFCPEEFFPYENFETRDVSVVYTISVSAGLIQLSQTNFTLMLLQYIKFICLIFTSGL